MPFSHDYIHQTQEAYEDYCDAVRREYCDEFWRVFASVYLERTVVVDSVLGHVKDTFVLRKEMRKLFATNVRALRRTMLSKAGDFPSLVMHSITVDLSTFELPGITTMFIYDYSYMNNHI